jgi:hypothetical protein
VLAGAPGESGRPVHGHGIDGKRPLAYLVHQIFRQLLPRARDPDVLTTHMFYRRADVEKAATGTERMRTFA